MLQFKQDDTQAVMILTLTELVTIPAPYYLFVFTHVTTKEVVAFVKAEVDDESEYPQRYNQFTINVSAVFAGKQIGEWHYKIYEQSNASNLDPDNAAGLLEEGKLLLDRATEIEYEMYNQGQTFRVYNG
jgi:CRISPR/Cas system CMR subunit Cmr4 (Cas7 group RAMP superfamily)